MCENGGNIISANKITAKWVFYIYNLELRLKTHRIQQNNPSGQKYGGHIAGIILTHCDLVTPYGVTNLDEHWLR